MVAMQLFHAALFIYIVASMPPKRKRDVVTPQWLAKTMDPFIEAGGQSWLRYDHSSKVKKAKRSKESIQKAIPWIRALHGFTTLSKKIVEEAMGIEVEKHRKKWGLKSVDTSDWVETMKNRMQNVLHHWRDAKKK